MSKATVHGLPESLVPMTKQLLSAVMVVASLTMAGCGVFDDDKESSSGSADNNSNNNGNTDSNTDNGSDTGSDTDNSPEAARYIKLFEDDFESGSMSKWAVVNVNDGSNEWHVESYAGDQFAVANCYGSSDACDTWMISPALDVTNFESLLVSFNSAWNYGTGTDQIALKVSSDYAGDVAAATWTDVSDRATWSDGAFNFVDSGDVDLTDMVGQPIVLAFHYAYPVADATKWEIDDVVIDGYGTGDFPLSAEVNLGDGPFYVDRAITFNGAASNGAGEPYTFSWNFGDGETSSEETPDHTFSASGSYEVVLTVTDSAGNAESVSSYLDVIPQTTFTVAEKASGDLRVATFNAGFDKQSAVGEQEATFADGEYVQARKVAEIIQRANPDILLLNEIDGNDDGATVNTFNSAYLQVAQADDIAAISYPYVYYGDNGNTNYCNTGAPIEESVDVDYNKDGDSDDPEDRYGFGNYNGQYCMAIFSKYPIDEANIRTFQEFKWADMPDYLVPTTSDGNWYSDDEMSVFRLSSKTHMDVPVNVDGTVVHVLATHPTPPSFDGDEDRNGMRNHDEIRLFADYINPESTYLYDDQGNTGVSLTADSRFVIVGDLNASAKEGDAYTLDGVRAIEQLTLSELVNPNLHEDSNTFQVPTSAAGFENASDSIYASTHTAGWAMRADYVLPSAFGLEISQGGVFWPRESDDLSYLITAANADDMESSDHRMVWMDLTITDGTVVDESTEQPAAEEIVFSDDFKSGFDNVTLVDNGDAAEGWESSSSYGAVVSCFNGTENCDDWLIVPATLDADAEYALSFESAYNYGSDPLGQIKLLISTNFTGDVAAASWADLSDQVTWSSGSWAFVDSGDIDLSAYAGESVHIAFQYSSASGSDAATWEITNFELVKQVVATADEVVFSDDFKSGLDSHDVVSLNDDGQDWTSDAGYGAKVSCFHGTAACDDWLIVTESLDAGADYVLNFESAYNYGNDPLSQIKLLISTDYAGDVATANWTDLSDQVTWSTGSWAFVESGDISLSAYAGQAIHIAFQYTSAAGGDAATWEITNLTITRLGNGVPVVEDTTGGTVLADSAPAATLNNVNLRTEGALAFEEVAVPAADSAESFQVVGSSGLTVDGIALADSGYKTLVKSGDLIDGNVYAQVKDSAGSDLFVSNYNEFSSILPIDDRIFAVSQFENIPGGMHLMELTQDTTTGVLTPISTEALDFSHVHGGYNHCAAMVTPWNTHMAAEEYEPNARARNAATGSIDSYYDPIADYHADLSLVQVNPYWYGYPVEVAVNVDGTDVTTEITKHYAVARVSIEVPYVMPDRKTMYLTDDQSTGGGLYMFVADEAEDMSAGTLYAMKWNQTDAGSDDNAGMGAADIEWINLGHATNEEISAYVNGDAPLAFADMFDAIDPADGQCALGYTSINFLGEQECLKLNSGMEQAASRLETRRYAAYMGATVEMAKEEGFTYNPHNHKIYLATTNVVRGMLNGSNETGGPNHMQLQSNMCGGIYEMSLGSNEEMGSEYVIGAARGEVAGIVEGSSCSVDGLAGPDNVAYVGYDTLIITEDTGYHDNNFVWAYNLQSKALTRILSAPSGAENTGPYMFNQINGFAYITNVVQHPAGESVDPSAGNEAELGYFGPIPLTAD
ncbi:DUF5017 domain-containing protein [Oceanobacter kriegii]|uniref:DUF5017 domain-containing protein n=1 Tax=Oceanobacter kriegii TaxID=64972 RepID=UPI00040304E3|nr:DUF5017 domain-containing protein [Oceanobacter kriegii]